MSVKDRGGLYMEVFSRHRAEEASSTWCASIHELSVSLLVTWYLCCCWFCCIEDLTQWLSVSTGCLNLQVSLCISLSYCHHSSVQRSYFNPVVSLHHWVKWRSSSLSEVNQRAVWTGRGPGPTGWFTTSFFPCCGAGRFAAELFITAGRRRGTVVNTLCHILIHRLGYIYENV